MLPLTFTNPADYGKVQENDKVSITGLQSFTPGVPLRMILKHADGSVDEVLVNHTFNGNQIHWFEAGSALNLIAAEGKRKAASSQNTKAKPVAPAKVAKRKLTAKPAKIAAKKAKPKAKKIAAKKLVKASKKKVVKKAKRNLRKKK